MIASLPMYATPQTALANGALWSGIRDALRDRGVAAPEDLLLSPGDLKAHWLDPDLVLSQTCGRPYKDHLHGKVTLVGTPEYGVDGCDPGHYRSLVVARADDHRDHLSEFSGTRFAYNEKGSQSGWAALATEAPQVLGGPLVETGGHGASVQAVREDRADFAAIDAVTLRLLKDGSMADGVKIVGQTVPRPGLPFIAAAPLDGALIFEAVEAAIGALSPAHRQTLGLQGIVRIPPEAYLALPDPKA